jgi:hypothetical protein
MRCKNCKNKCMEFEYPHGIENMHVQAGVKNPSFADGTAWRWCRTPAQVAMAKRAREK